MKVGLVIGKLAVAANPQEVFHVIILANPALDALTVESNLDPNLMLSFLSKLVQRLQDHEAGTCGCGQHETAH